LFRRDESGAFRVSGRRDKRQDQSGGEKLEHASLRGSDEYCLSAGAAGELGSISLLFTKDDMFVTAIGLALQKADGSDFQAESRDETLFRRLQRGRP
jgi:hypothetical protein